MKLRRTPIAVVSALTALAAGVLTATTPLATAAPSTSTPDRASRLSPQPNARPEPSFARGGRGGLLDPPFLHPATLDESLANEGVIGHELRRVVVRVGCEAD